MQQEWVHGAMRVAGACWWRIPSKIYQLFVADTRGMGGWKEAEWYVGLVESHCRLECHDGEYDDGGEGQEKRGDGGNGEGDHVHGVSGVMQSGMVEMGSCRYSQGWFG